MNILCFHHLSNFNPKAFGTFSRSFPSDFAKRSETNGESRSVEDGGGENRREICTFEHRLSLEKKKNIPNKNDSTRYLVANDPFV